jgi:hypothetical protein
MAILIILDIIFMRDRKSEGRSWLVMFKMARTV